MDTPERIRERFFRELQATPSPTVLELGTKRWDINRCTTSRDLVLKTNSNAKYYGVDVESGADVDILWDVLEPYPPRVPRPDFIIFHSILEHVERPWDAVKNLYDLAKPNCRIWVATHQTYPLHNYPKDYYRFSKDALNSLFVNHGGWILEGACYSLPCVITPISNQIHHTTWNFIAESYLSIDGLYRKHQFAQ